MVEAFVGLVGGGKTFSSTRRMCEYVLKGGSVCTNILFKGFDPDTSTFTPDAPFIQYLLSRGWSYQQGQYNYIPFETMAEKPDWYSDVKGGLDRTHRTLLVIDEATDLFDTLDRNKLSSDSSYRSLFRFLRLSRHAHIDVLFICQDFFSINSRLRGLVGAIWKSTDLQNFRLPTFHIPLPFNCFLLQKFDRTGKLELYREFLAKDARIFGIYESEAFHDALGITFSGAVPDGRTNGGKKRMNKFQKFLLFASLAASIYCVFQSRNIQKNLSTLQSAIETINVSSPSVPASVSSVNSVSSVEPVDQFVRGLYEYSFYGSYPVLYFDGKLIKQGMITEYGKCMSITPNSTLCISGSTRTFLLPASALDAPGGPPKTTAFVPPGASSAEMRL